MRELDAEAVEEREVRSDFDLRRGFGFQLCVAETTGGDVSAGVHVIRLVLRVESRRRPGRTARRANSEVAHLRHVPEGLLGNAPDRGQATKRRPAIVCAEQRAAVIAERAVENVPVLPVQLGTSRIALVLDGFGVRPRAL